MEFTRGPANADDILTSTLDLYRAKLTEQWLSGNPVTKEMMKQGNVKFEDGGNTIVEDLEYQDNDTVGWVAQTDSVSTAINQILTQSKYSWAVIAGTVGIGDFDDAKNKGRSATHNLIKVRMNNLKNTFIDKMETALVNTTTPNVKQIWSLIDIVDTSDPSIGNYGDIPRSTYTWWQPTETASGSFKTQGLEDLRTAYNTVSKSLSDPISLIVMTQTVYESYQARLTPFERLAKVGDLEFDHLAFHGKPVFYSEDMQAQTVLGLNMKYLKLTINSNMNFKNQPFVRAPGGQSKSAVVQTMCQVTASRVASHFKLTGVTA